MKPGRRAAPAALLGLLAALLPTPLAAQAWVADASAGSTRYDAVAGAVGTRSAMLTLQRLGERWLYLSAGLPLDGEAIPWGAAGGGGRLSTALRSLELGIDGAAHGYAYREPTLDATGSGLTLVALPFVGFAAGPARLELRSGAMHHLSAYEGTSEGRTVHESAVQAWLPLGSGARVSAEGRLVRATEGSYPFAGSSVELPVGPATAWASAGRWLADELDDTAWGVGGRIHLPLQLTLRASYEREASDPLFFNGPRSGWTIGVSRALGGPAPAPVTAVPVTLRPPTGGVVIRLSVSDAPEAVSVGGDFNEWAPVPMRRVGDQWEATLNIASGVYRYAFQRPDGSWFVPDSVPNRAEDGFGGYNAVLVVAGS